MLQTKIEVLVLFVVLCGLVSADKERPISVSDTGEGTKCDADIEIAKLCLSCSRLQQEIAVQLTDCCADDKALNFCDICVENPYACLKETYEMVGDNDVIGSQEGKGQYMDKRWGRMFFGKGRIGYGKTVGKRYGRVFFGKRPRGFLYGRVGKRDDAEGYEDGDYPSDDSDDISGLDKRYGRLFTSGKWGMYSKRFGPTFFGKSRPRSRIWD